MLTARKVLAEAKNMPGVILAYETEKRPDGPNIIVNMSGVNEVQIREAEESIKKIHGVKWVSVQSGHSLLHD
jgi:hypothetical protein